MIVGATVLFSEDLIAIPEATVAFAGGIITDVVADGSVAAPDGSEVIDGHGKTLLPGFIDAHVHIGFYETSRVLAGGVTTVRDLGWPPDEIAALVERSRSDMSGPAIVAAGPMLTARGGYPSRAAWAPAGTALELDGPHHGEGAVDRVARAGFSIVKVALNPPVGPVLDAPTLTAVVDAAHARGLKVTGHIYGLDELHKAIDAGVDELAHMLMSDEAIPEATIQRMVSADMTIVPTLSVFEGSTLQTAIANLAAYRAAGGRIVYGTDLGNEGPQPGIDRREVAAMEQAGMSGEEIIRAATVTAGAWLRLERKGSITVGNNADLVLVEGDPLTDPSALLNIAGVWRRGVRAS